MDSNETTLEDKIAEFRSASLTVLENMLQSSSEYGELYDESFFICPKNPMYNILKEHLQNYNNVNFLQLYKSLNSAGVSFAICCSNPKQKPIPLKPKKKYEKKKKDSLTEKNKVEKTDGDKRRRKVFVKLTEQKIVDAIDSDYAARVIKGRRNKRKLCATNEALNIGLNATHSSSPGTSQICSQPSTSSEACLTLTPSESTTQNHSLLSSNSSSSRTPITSHYPDTINDFNLYNFEPSKKKTKMTTENIEPETKVDPRDNPHNHECFYPVILGSRLHHWVLKLTSKTLNSTLTPEEYKNIKLDKLEYPVFEENELFDITRIEETGYIDRLLACPKFLFFLTGLFIILGKFYFIPRILINNRSLPHCVKSGLLRTRRQYFYHGSKGFKFELVEPCDELTQQDDFENFDVSTAEGIKPRILKPLLPVVKEFKKVGSIYKDFSYHLGNLLNLEKKQIEQYIQVMDKDIATNGTKSKYFESYCTVGNFLNDIADIQKSRFIYRNSEGIDFNDVSPFVKTMEQNGLDSQFYSIHNVTVMEGLYDIANNFFIDDIQNKLLLSPEEIFDRTRGATPDDQGRDFVKRMFERGRYEKVVSLKIKFNNEIENVNRVKNFVKNSSFNSGSSKSKYMPQSESSFLQLVKFNDMSIMPVRCSTVNKPAGQNVPKVSKLIYPSHFGFLDKYSLGNMANMGNKSSLVYDVVTSVCFPPKEIEKIKNAWLNDPVFSSMVKNSKPELDELIFKINKIHNEINQLSNKIKNQTLSSSLNEKKMENLKRELKVLRMGFKDFIYVDNFATVYKMVYKGPFENFLIACKRVSKYVQILRSKVLVHIRFTSAQMFKPLFVTNEYGEREKILLSRSEIQLYFEDKFENGEFESLSLAAMIHQRNFSEYSTFEKATNFNQGFYNVLPSKEIAIFKPLLSKGLGIFNGLKVSKSKDFDESTLTHFTTHKSSRPVFMNCDETTSLLTVSADFGESNCEDACLLNEKVNFNQTVLYTDFLTMDKTSIKNVYISSQKGNGKKLQYSEELHSDGSRYAIIVHIGRIISKSSIEFLNFTNLNIQKTVKILPPEKEPLDESNRKCLKKRTYPGKLYIYHISKKFDGAAILKIHPDQIFSSVELVTETLDKTKLRLDVIIGYKVPYIDVMKLMSTQGSKGVCHVANLSFLRDKYGNEPDIITSVHGNIGRETIVEKKMMASNEKSELYINYGKLYSTEETYTNEDPFDVADLNRPGSGWEKMNLGQCGKVEYICVANFPSIIKSTNTARNDLLSMRKLCLNKCPNSHYQRQQDAFIDEEKNKVYPNASRSNLELLEIQKTKIKFLFDSDGTKKATNRELLQKLFKSKMNFEKKMSSKCNHSKKILTKKYRKTKKN